MAEQVGFDEAVRLKAAYRTSLAVVALAHPPAAAQGKAECCRSGVCCWTRPGALAEADVEPLAALLGVGPAWLFRNYLVVDRIGGKLCVHPRRADEEGGRFLTARQTWTANAPCVFLGADNACRVHAAKPQDCRNYRCWEPGLNTLTEFPEAAALELGWDGVE